MQKLFLGLLMIWAIAARAHQPDLSTTMLFQRADGRWMLQITSSLGAFQAAVGARFPNKPYSSAESFQRLLLEHLRECLFLCVNGRDTLQLGNAFVRMGHETTVVFEVGAVPEPILSLLVQNSSFRDIYGSRSLLLVRKEGLLVEQGLLDSGNAHRAHWVHDGQQLRWRGAAASEGPEFLLPAALSLLLLIGIAGIWGRHAFFRSEKVGQKP